MSSSMQGTEAQIEFVYDVTERVKEILVAVNDGTEAHPLIEYTEKQNYQNIILDFRRGMVQIVDGRIFNRDILPPEYEICGDREIDEIRKEEFTAAKEQMIKTYLSEIEGMFSCDKNVLYDKKNKTENFSQYNSQAFHSISTTRIFSPVLGGNAEHYNPKFANGRVCHFWPEEINKEAHLCMLLVDDGFYITCNADKDDVYYLPGAMIIELKVPLSAIEERAPITEKHITRVLASSTELFNLLNINPENFSLVGLGYSGSSPELAYLKNSFDSFLQKNGSRQPLPNLGDQIRNPNFKDAIPGAVNKDVTLSAQQLESLRMSIEQPISSDSEKVASDEQASGSESIANISSGSSPAESEREQSSPSKGSDSGEEFSRARSKFTLFQLSKPLMDEGLDAMENSFMH